MAIIVKVLGFFSSSATVTEENNLKKHSLVVFAHGGQPEITIFGFTVPNYAPLCGKTTLVDIQIHDKYSNFTSYH